MAIKNIYGYTCKDEIVLHNAWMAILYYTSNRESIIIKNRLYAETDEGKSKREKYLQSDKYRAYQKRYAKSEASRARIKKYQKSDKYKAKQKKYKQGKTHKEWYKNHYSVHSASEVNLRKLRENNRRYQKSAKRVAYYKAKNAIQKIRIADTGKTYQQLFSELKNKYEQEFKINPPKKRKQKFNTIKLVG